MKMVNKQICKYILEIAVAIFFVIITIPIWNNVNAKSYSAIAESYAKASLVDLIEINKIDSSIEITNENNLNNIKEAHYQVKNYTSKTEEYKLVFKISKNNNVKFLTLTLNDDSKNITDYITEEDNNYYYIILDNNVAKGYEAKDYYIKMWIDENLYSNFTSASLVYSLFVI